MARLGTLDGAEGACSRRRISPGYVVARVDTKEVRLPILASAILVGVPLIVNAIHDVLSGRWDEHLGRRRPSDSAEAGDAAPHLRGRPVEQLAAHLRRLRVAVATTSGVRRLINWRTGSPPPAVNTGLPDVEHPTRAWEEHGRPGARHRTDTGRGRTGTSRRAFLRQQIRLTWGATPRPSRRCCSDGSGPRCAGRTPSIMCTIRSGRSRPSIGVRSRPSCRTHAVADRS